MPTDLNIFRVFTTVAKTNSFATAARALGVTRSAVAKAIGRLEQQTGARLFQRTTRSVALTDEGHSLYARANETIKELEAALEDIAGRREQPSGMLRLSAPEAYGRSRIMPALTAFLTKWPNLEADVTFIERPVDVVAEGFDVVFQPGSLPKSQELVARTMSRHNIHFCAAPSYLERHGTPKTFTELTYHSCLPLLQGSMVRPWTAKGSDNHELIFEPHGRARFNSCTALLEATVAGLGISQLPDYVVTEEIKQGSLKRILAAVEPEPVPILALYPTRKQLSPRVRFFLDALLSR